MKESSLPDDKHVVLDDLKADRRTLRQRGTLLLIGTTPGFLEMTNSWRKEARQETIMAAKTPKS